MKIWTYDKRMYETEKIEVGGWDEEHEKYSHDRIVFFDEIRKDWRNLKANEICSITA